MADDLFGMAWEQVYNEADSLAQRVDKNAPREAATPKEVFARVESGFADLEKNTDFMLFMEQRKDAE